MDAATVVGDITIPVDRYPSVRDNATLRDAVRTIESAHLEVKLRRSLPRCLLVFDGIDVMVGYVRRRDIMRGLEPRFLLTEPLKYRDKPFDVAVDPNLSEIAFDRLLTGIGRQGDRPVSDVMRPVETVLNASDHLVKAVTAMVTLDLSLIPVLDEGELVGVVRSVDVFHELAKLVLS